MPLIRTTPTGANDPYQSSLQTLNNLLDCEFGGNPLRTGLALHRGPNNWGSVVVGGVGMAAGAIVTGTATLDLSAGDFFTLTLDHTQTVTLAMSNPTVGQQFTLALKQDGTGSCLATWFAGILWPAASAPTLTTAAGKFDVFAFRCVSAGVYLSLYSSQNL